MISCRTLLSSDLVSNAVIVHRGSLRALLGISDESLEILGDS
jgi:hypothetical protein